MKKLKLNFLALLAILFAFSACNDDDETPDPLLGTWDLEEIEFVSGPQGTEPLLGFRDLAQVGWRAYTISFNTDNSFELEIRPEFGNRVNLEGTWEQEDDEITLDYEDGDSEVWIVNDIAIEELELLKESETWIFFDTDSTTVEIPLDVAYYFNKDN